MILFNWDHCPQLPSKFPDSEENNWIELSIPLLFPTLHLNQKMCLLDTKTRLLFCVYFWSTGSCNNWMFSILNKILFQSLLIYLWYIYSFVRYCLLPSAYSYSACPLENTKNCYRRKSTQNQMTLPLKTLLTKLKEDMRLVYKKWRQRMLPTFRSRCAVWPGQAPRPGSASLTRRPQGSRGPQRPPLAPLALGALKPRQPPWSGPSQLSLHADFSFVASFTRSSLKCWGWIIH